MKILDNLLSRISEEYWQKSVLLIHSGSFKKNDEYDYFIKSIKSLTANFYAIDQVEENPSVEFLYDNLGVLKFHGLLEFNPDLILCIGGGSVIDYGKILSRALTINDISSLPTIDQITTNQVKCIKVIAVPTTAGTGAESTRFSTLWDKTNNKKLSLVSDVPEAFYIPELTYSLPIQVIINTALDALSHSLESIWNKNANVVSINHASKALHGIIQSLYPILVNSENITDKEIRELLLVSAGEAGKAINLTFTSIAHSISYPLTLHYNVPHGLACSFTLPALVKLNSELIKYHLNTDSWEKLNDIFKILDLKNLIHDNYLNRDQALELIDDMKNPSRLGTYIHDVDDDYLKNLIIDSFPL